VATAPIKDDWSVKKLEFSAVSIGVAMTDHKTGYSSFTNGASSIKITKTTDGGTTWTPVKNQTTALMVMGVAASTSPKLDVVTTGMGATKYSTDGDTFKSSLFGPFVSQSIQASSGGRVVLATEAGILMSKNGGETYSHKKVTGLKTAGRYAAAPSDQVIYMTAGQWPEHSNASSREVQLSSNLRVTNRSWGGQFGSRIGVETGARAHPIVEAGAPPPPPPTGYAAQIVKSTDGGNTWTTLMTDMDNFYFNEINCFDETHCVAVGEGFGHDGSKAPGGYVYVTTDGTNFTLSHHEAVDGTSFMAAKMFSTTAHVAGGMMKDGISLHTTDGGKTYTKKGSKVKGMSITAMSFVTPDHAFATSISSLQICSLLEFGVPPAAA